MSWRMIKNNMSAIVDVLNLDGTLISHNEFVTNQEAADFMVPLVGQHVDVNYVPSACTPDCKECADRQEDYEEIRLLLDIL